MPALLGGRYRLDTLIGGGGMGEVWQAHDHVLDRSVAIKIIRPHLADDENIRARLRVEAQLAGKLHHPGIVDVFDYGEDHEDGKLVPFLVMPLIDGAPLSAVLAERGLLSTGETMAVIAEIAASLHVAHAAGIVHRDLKPGNILLTADGRVMLVDFGIAHAAGGEPLTQTGTLIGTADYLSPEQAAGRPATPSSDLYSLGVVAYACLTGNLPFHRDSDIATALAHLQADAPDLPGTVPAEAVALVDSMLAKDPGERPSSATAVALAAATLASAVPTPSGQAPALGGEPTRPEAAARPQDTLPGIVERPVTFEAGDANPPDGGSVVAAEHVRRGRSPRRMALLSSAVIALAAAALGWLLLGDGGGDSVVVPNVAGQMQAAATSRLESAGLVVRVRPVNAAGAKAGEVVNQDPDAETRVDDGSTVTLSVATGRVRIPVDELVGATYGEAAARLDELGLKATARYATSDRTAGTVTAVDPTSTARLGSSVTLTVAGGTSRPSPQTDQGKDDDEVKKGKKDDKEPKEPKDSGTPSVTTPTSSTPTPSPTTPESTATEPPPGP